MFKKDCSFYTLIVLVILFVVFIWLVGFMGGYLHVIKNSEAYLIEHGDVIVLQIDGHGYEYAATPAFYNRITSYLP